MLLVEEGSGCFGSVFVSLESRRPALVRGESCGSSLLMTCGSASIKDQSE